MTRTHAAAWALVSHGNIIFVENPLTEREILLCLTAVCSLPDSDLKRDVLRQLVPVLERLNHPLQSLEA